MYWYEMNGWGYTVMTLAMLAFWALVVVAVVAVFRHTPAARPGSWTSGAEQLLAERFARGEIDEDEYNRRLAVLRQHGTRWPTGPTGPTGSAGQAGRAGPPRPSWPADKQQGS